MFTKTSNTRHGSFLRMPDKARRLSSRPDQIAKRIFQISKEVALPVVGESRFEKIQKNVIDELSTSTQNALGDHLYIPPGHSKNFSFNSAFKTTNFKLAKDMQNYLDEPKESSETSESKQRDKSVKIKKNKQITRKISRRVRDKSQVDNVVVLDRKHCFNEAKLKEILDKFHLPIDFQSIRVMKEHAKETNKDVIDMKPALMRIKKSLPKSIRRKITKNMK